MKMVVDETELVLCASRNSPSFEALISDRFIEGDILLELLSATV